jgi:GPH family glycoside/pentoside/hexuronide:cation symporter
VGHAVTHDAHREPSERLTASTKFVYSLGDHTVNLVLSAASLLFFKFLTDVAELRPVLAGAVVWVARVVDAFSDPAMGRLSDLTRWKVGRRRGYFLLGAIPFGVFFALMWQDVPFDSQAGKFSYYAGVYILTSLAMTVLSIPYMALLPEMANSYDERTSFNTYRSAASVIGTFAAVAMKPLAEALGGGATGWASAGAVVGIWLTLPWLAVFKVSFERPEASRSNPLEFREGLRLIAAHANYRTLAAFFILARIAVDLIGAMFLFYFVDFLGREGDFETTMFLFLSIVVLSLPFWLRVAMRHDKRTIFIVGASWWIIAQFFIFAGQPDWPRWAMFAIASMAAIGYAVADLMPWSMLGDVIDEDELASGERREGVYVGFFTFLRKLGGASAVLLIGLVLDLAGYSGGAGAGAQSDLAVQTIRVLTSLVPALFLALAVVVAFRYSLGRAAHQRVLDQLRMRERPR